MRDHNSALSPPHTAPLPNLPSCLVFGRPRWRKSATTGLYSCSTRNRRRRKATPMLDQRRSTREAFRSLHLCRSMQNCRHASQTNIFGKWCSYPHAHTSQHCQCQRKDCFRLTHHGMWYLNLTIVESQSFVFFSIPVVTPMLQHSLRALSLPIQTQTFSNTLSKPTRVSPINISNPIFGWRNVSKRQPWFIHH